jgi:hypothetical protein
MTLPFLSGTLFPGGKQCVNAEALVGIVERHSQLLFDADVSQWRSRLSQAQFTSSGPWSYPDDPCTKTRAFF